MKKFIYSLILITQIFTISNLFSMFPGSNPRITEQPTNLPKPDQNLFNDKKEGFFNVTPPHSPEESFKITPITEFNETSPAKKRMKRKGKSTNTTKGLLDLDSPVERVAISVLFPDTPKSPESNHDYVQDVLDSVLEPFIIFAGGNGNATSPAVKLVRTLLAIDDKEQALIFNGNTPSGKKVVKPVDNKTALFFINVFLRFVEIHELDNGKRSIEFKASDLTQFLNDSKSELVVDGKKVNVGLFIKNFLRPKNGKVAFVTKPLFAVADVVEKNLKALNSVNNSDYELNIIILAFYKIELIYKKLISKEGVHKLEGGKVKIQDCINRKEFFKQILRDIIANPVVESLLRIDNTHAIGIDDCEFAEELQKSVVQINSDIDKLLHDHDEYGRINVILSLITSLFDKAKNKHNENDIAKIQFILCSIYNKIVNKIYDNVLYQDSQTGVKFISNKYLPLLASAYRLANCLTCSERYFKKLKELVVISFEHISDPVITIKNGKTKVQGGHFLFKDEFVRKGDSFEFRDKYLTNDKDEVVEKDGSRYLVDSFKVLYESQNAFLGYWVIKNERTGNIIGYKISTVCIAGIRENFYRFVNDVFNNSNQCIGRNVAISKIGDLRLKVAFSDIAKLKDLKEDIKIESILTLFPIIYGKINGRNMKKINVTDPNKNINVLDNKLIETFPICSISELAYEELKKEQKRLFDCEKIGYEDYYSKQNGQGLLYYSNCGNYIRFYLPASEYNFVKTRKNFVSLIEYI
ncbi:MAG: hypothetical protein ABIA74_02005 [bacterium]